MKFLVFHLQFKRNKFHFLSWLLHTLCFNKMLKIGFSILDYIVFCVVLLISFAIGIFHAFKSNNNYTEYVAAAKSLGVVPIAVSLCASFNSGFMILGKSFIFTKMASGLG